MYLNLKDNIYQNKQELMGLAICLIMIYHSNFEVDKVNNIVSYFLKHICNIGVDIFMLLSGFTLANSFNRNSNIGAFYKKRLLRILPPYLIVFSAVYFYIDIVKQCDLGKFIYDLFFMNFFIDHNAYIWFVPVIITYYFITPLYIFIYKKYTIGKYIPYLLMVIIGLLFISGIGFWQLFGLYRLPIYLIGVNLFYRTEQNRTEQNHFVQFIFLMLSIGAYIYVVYINRSLVWCVFFTYIPIVLFLINNFSIKIKQIRSFLFFLGGLTLELYLIHERLQPIVDHFINNVFLRCFLSIVIAIMIALLLKRLFDLPIVRRYLS